jgi:hypothetical protein
MLKVALNTIKKTNKNILAPIKSCHQYNNKILKKKSNPDGTV